jgi:hypothetical protein
MIENRHLIFPTIFRPLTNVASAMSTKLGGTNFLPFGMNLSFKVGDRDESVKANRQQFFAALGTNAEQVIQPNQVHSSTIVDASSFDGGVECDGLVTNQTGRYLAISVADCSPILLASKNGNVVAAVHAGWRGTAKGIVPKAVKTMQEQFRIGPDEILAWIGPSASACCYQVGQEVADQFAPSEVRTEAGRHFLNLKLANRNQLLEAGLAERNIEIHPACTICEKETFHSFRRDASRSGRMLAIIGIQ